MQKSVSIVFHLDEQKYLNHKSLEFNQYYTMQSMYIQEVFMLTLSFLIIKIT